jgi:hypothetical protein
MTRLAAALGLALVGSACGHDDQLKVYLVFPDGASETKAKKAIFKVWHDPAKPASCASPPAGTPDIESEIAWPAPGGPVVRQSIPEGPVIFTATVQDDAGANFLTGCTEAIERHGRDVEVQIVLHP